MKKTLEFKAGTLPLFTASNENLAAGVLLSDLAGWDTFGNFEISTAPKLVGAGSYITDESIGEREVEIIIDIKENFRDLRKQITQFALTFTNFEMILKTTRVSPILTYVETERLFGKIKNINVIRTIDETGTLSLSLLCTNPTIINS